MTREPNYDRFIPLSDLNHYPGSNYLDRTIQLLWTENTTRRVWLMTSSSTPIIHIEDAVMVPKKVHENTPRWIDYGLVDMPFMALSYPIWEGLVPIRFQGLDPAECDEAYLVVTTRLDVSLASCTIVESQRRLWGLSQSDAGSTTLRPTRLVVGQPARFRVHYRAGPRGLPAGAIIRFVIPRAFIWPQVKDPNSAGFIVITQADCRATLVEIRNMLETHEKTSIICRLDSPLKAGGQLALEYHCEQTFIYPTVMDEVEMRTWYSNLPPLTASVALSERAPFVNMLPANGHSFAFVPGPCERLHLFLPGRRFASESLMLKGTFTDRYRNVPPTGLIDLDFDLWLISRDEEWPLGTPAEHFVARHRFEMPLPTLSPGIYRVQARRKENEETGALKSAQDSFPLAQSNPLEIIPDGSGDRLYWGEIHAHTELGDGGGDFEGVYRHAKEEGCLEFATVSEHAEYFSDNQWQWMQDVINHWNEPGRFVTLIGYEFIGLQKDRIVYTSRPRLDLMRGYYHATRTLDKVWTHFHGDEEVVGGPHATMVHKTKWEHHDSTVERFIEIYSMWGACDFRQGPLVASWIEEGRGLTANEILLKGAKLGFTAGGDCHDGRVGFASEDPDGQGTTPHTFASIILYRCGMTAANMPRLGRQELIRSLRNRQTYATTGARLLLEFTVAGLAMGSIGKAERAECWARIHATSSLQQVEIIKDGQIVWQQEVQGLDVEIQWIDPDQPVKEHYYYLHLIQEDGHQAWASPIWLSPLNEVPNDPISSG